jgi:hypothetical protein
LPPPPRMMSTGQRSSSLLCSTSTTSPEEAPGGVDYPPNCIGQPEGDKAPGGDGARSSKKWDPSAMRGASISAARRRGVATTPVAGGATSYGPGSPTARGRGPRAASTSWST